MFQEQKQTKKIVGMKQLRRAVRDKRVAHVLMADDADPWVREEIEALCREAGVIPAHISTMKALGAACGISVGAAVAATLQDSTEDTFVEI